MIEIIRFRLIVLYELECMHHSRSAVSQGLLLYYGNGYSSLS
jgi:hypothetical protein